MRRIVKPFEWIVALFCLPAMGLMSLGLVNPRGYAAGMRNAEAPFPFVEVFMFIAGALLMLTAIIWALVTWGRSSKATRIFNLLVLGIPVLITILMLSFPLHMYRRGLARWVARELRPLGIRAWMAAGPSTSPATAPTVIPPPGMAAPPALVVPGDTPNPPLKGAQFVQVADCPADISAMAPQQVWLTPDKRGVILLWGGGFWDGGRGIFVGLDPTASPPKEIPGWTRSLPGIYVSDKMPSIYAP